MSKIPVYVNVYDLIFDGKNYNHIPGFGLYHSGVQIGDVVCFANFYKKCLGIWIWGRR
jgi:hypothetical protein